MYVCKSPFNLLDLFGTQTQRPTNAEYPRTQEILIEINRIQDHKTGLKKFYKNSLGAPGRHHQ